MDAPGPQIPLTVLIAGESEKANVLALLEAHGLQESSVAWWDAQELNSYAIGDYGLFALDSVDGLLIVDPKYDAGKPLDDAVSSKWAQDAASSCAFRPPLMIQRGLLESNGDGICLMSTKTYSMNPGLSDLQVQTLLTHYFGCSLVIPVQPLQGDGKGRIDTLFRFTSDSKLLAGLYELSQDAPNRLIMQANFQALEKKLPSTVTLTPFPMPSPRLLEGEAAWPSYLSFVLTQDRILVPEFPTQEASDPSAEAARKASAHQALLAEFPAKTIAEIPASTLLAVGLRLNSVLLPLPEGPWAPCQSPSDRCTSNTLDSCPGCFDQCVALGNSCLNDTSVAQCKMGQDNCLQVNQIPCQEQWSCLGGLCTAPASPCDDMPAQGRCDGDILLKCTGPSLIKVECNLAGLICAANSQGEPDCVPFCTNSCSQTGQTRCDDLGVSLQTCDTGDDGCLHWMTSACESGLCSDGQCDGADPDVTSDMDSMAQPDLLPVEDSGISGGFRPKDGCAAGALSPAPLESFALLLLTLLFLLRMARPGRRPKGV